MQTVMTSERFGLFVCLNNLMMFFYVHDGFLKKCRKLFLPFTFICEKVIRDLHGTS